MTYSNQFPTRPQIKLSKPQIGTLWYTYPGTGEKRAVYGAKDLPFDELEVIKKNLIQRGWHKENFDTKYRNK